MIKKHNILFIINPISGIGKKETIPKAIIKHLDLDRFSYDLAYTQYKNHGHELTLDRQAEYDIIVAIGGDGTVSEIGTALINSKCALGIIPAGSGNGIARHLNIPLSLKKAIRRLNEFKVLNIDTGTVNGIPFIGTCGFGFDAHIAKKFDDFGKRGFSSYIKLVKKEYKSFSEITYTINGEYDKTGMMCCIANSSQFGNGFTVSPHSKIDDGSFELIFIDRIPIFHMPKMLKQFFTKKIHQSKYFEQIKLDTNFSIGIKNQGESAFHIDGEPLVGTNLFEVEIKPKSLSIIH